MRLSGDHVEPVTISKRSFKNLWQDYRVYSDRIELRAWVVLHTFVIPFQDLRAITVRRAGSTGLALALKLDLADLYPHIAIERKTGLFKDIRFTPDDPEMFLSTVKSCAGHLYDITYG